MSERARYPTGKPCWFEFATDDVAAAQSFYRALFGWDFTENDGIHQALVNNKAVAAITAARPGHQPNWTVYLATDDIDATARAIVAAGGTMLVPPEAASGGRRALAADPTGGAFGLWQGGSFGGSDLLEAPGAVCWAELSSRAPPAAAEFFGTVFGVEIRRPFPGFEYVQLRIDDKPAAGILGAMHEKRPHQGVQAWLVYFHVAATDATVDAAASHGGTIVEPAEDTPFGRLAIIADPFGARLAVIEREGATQ